jgi:hypothetical protein
MSETLQTNPLSHFSIGGIHGLPFVPWEGAGGNRIIQGTQWLGYCNHGNALFPTWHRPYVALYEVGVVSRDLACIIILINCIASTAAARSWRCPVVS